MTPRTGRANAGRNPTHVASRPRLCVALAAPQPLPVPRGEASRSGPPLALDSPHALSPGLHDAPALRLHAEGHDLTSDATSLQPPVSLPGGSLRGKDRALPSCPGAEVTSKGRAQTIVFIRRRLAALRLLFPVLPGVGKSWVERAKKDKGEECQLRRGVTPGGVSRLLAGSGGAVLRVGVSKVAYLLGVESPLAEPLLGAMGSLLGMELGHWVLSSQTEAGCSFLC